MHFSHPNSALTTPIPSVDLPNKLHRPRSRRRPQNFSPATLATLLCWVAVATALAGCAQGLGAGKGDPAPEAISIVVNPVSTSLVAGKQQQFTAKVTGTTNTAVTWTATGGTISSSGLYTAASDAGNFSVTATSAADFSRFAQAAITVTSGSAPAVSVQLQPGAVSLAEGAQQQFTATVTGSTNEAVTWTATGGTMASTGTTTGLFTAGKAAGIFSITATSVADTTKSAHVSVTVTAPAPVVAVSVQPPSVSLAAGAKQQFTAMVTGASNAAVTWTATGGTISSAGLFTAGNTTGTGFSVTATSAADTSKSAHAAVTITAASSPVSVSLQPTSVSLAAGAKQQFTATVTGSSNTAVTWTATGGTISSAGLFTASSTAGTSFSVTATSAADTSKSAHAAVTITAAPPPPVVNVSVAPSSATVLEGAKQQFTAAVTGSSNMAVTWSATGGTVSSAGLFTAGNSAGTSFSVTATSAADTSKSAHAAVTVTAPPPPAGTATSVSKDGVTWTFSEAVPVGQFVNGDYYVVGPVTLTKIDPAPTTSSPYENGSVKNLPTANSKSGFDSRLNDGADESFWFDASVRQYVPISLKPGDSLVSSISVAQIHTLPEVMRSTDKNISPVATVSVLTVLATQPTADAFRPSYCDRNQTIYHADALQRNLLPSLAPPNPGSTPTLAQFEAWYRRPWIDTDPFLFDAPGEYMPDYGQHIAFADSYAALLLMLNFPADQKVNLTNYFVQYGIDLYGCVQAGYGWPAFGGHRSGRKLPIIFAGILLNDSGMKSVSANHPDQFGEDMQTLYINKLPPAGTFAKAWQGATVIYGGHYGVKVDGTPINPGLYGPYEQLQPSAWPLLNPTEQLGEGYRRCCTSTSWVGEALAIHLLHAESVWNYPPFFDYVDRWMTEDDTQAVAEIKAQSGFDYSAGWLRQGQTKGFLQGEFPQYTFIDDMWAAYRH
jgi:Bacterial Ig-like domain (group 2)